MDATASAIATCIIAMAREPSGAALGPSGVARMVLIPMRFQNATVSPDSVLRATASPELDLRAEDGVWLAASGPASNAMVARTTTNMAAKLRVMIHPLCCERPQVGSTMALKRGCDAARHICQGLAFGPDSGSCAFTLDARSVRFFTHAP